MATYINHRIYTDVESFRVLSINGTKGRAIRVEKKPVGLIQIPGGFAAHCPNQHEAFSNSTDIVEVGEAFDIEYRNGVWGEWCVEGFVMHGITSEGVERQRRWSENNGDLCEAFLENDGTYTIRVTVLTKTGKPKRHFHKLGILENECRYFYDYNF